MKILNNFLFNSDVSTALIQQDYTNFDWMYSEYQTRKYTDADLEFLQRFVVVQNSICRYLTVMY